MAPMSRRRWAADGGRRSRSDAATLSRAARPPALGDDPAASARRRLGEEAGRHPLDRVEAATGARCLVAEHRDREPLAVSMHEQGRLMRDRPGRALLPARPPAALEPHAPAATG